MWAVPFGSVSDLEEDSDLGKTFGHNSAQVKETMMLRASLWVY